MVDEILKSSEERLRLLVESVVDYAIFLLDPDGRVASWNVGAQRIKGYTQSEILGRHFSCFYPAEAVADGWPEHELKVARAEGRFEDEGWRLRKDGTKFWANVIITPLFDAGRLVGFAKVTRDLTERREKEALKLAEERMNEFLAMLGHELRNPLAPIRNAVRAMQVAPLSDETLRWSTAVIERQVAHLTHLVDDLLDVGRITSGKIVLHAEPVAVADVIARAIESSRPLIDERRHALEVALPDEPLWVRGDLTRLAQVVLNLLNNAAKFTPDGGRIEVAAARDGDDAVALRVRDSGIGITPELLPQVFRLFTQGSRSLDRSEAGLGIGLTLVERLVRLHGGHVAAASEGPGRGSEFVVRLPLVPAPQETPAAGRAERTAGVGSARVLVVDDNRDSADTMAMLLGLWGCMVRSAADGAAALAAARELRPDAVLLDIGLPGMDGYEVAWRLRQLPGLEGVLLIAMTGYGREHDRRRAREAGFDHHLVKPVDPQELKKLLALGARPAGRGTDYAPSH